MKNHWLDRKKERERPFSTLISTACVDPNAAMSLPPITINWGVPPVVTVYDPSYYPCSTTKEFNESKINEGCFSEIPIPSIISFQPGEGWANPPILTDTCGVIGTLPCSFAGGEGGNQQSITVC